METQVSKADDNKPARVIGKKKLEQLLKAQNAANSRMAEERGALGNKLKAAEENDHLNLKAFRIIKPLYNMDVGKREHLWRDILLYGELLGFGAQLDLVDEARRAAARDESEEDEGNEEGGEEESTEEQPASDPVADVLAGMDVPEVGRFRAAIAEALTGDAINAGLERFCNDHPEHAEQALGIAQERLAALAADQGGGEDLRPTALREGEQATAQQTAEAAAATSTKRTRKRPASPAVDAARDAGVNSSIH